MASWNLPVVIACSLALHTEAVNECTAHDNCRYCRDGAVVVRDPQNPSKLVYGGGHCVLNSGRVCVDIYTHLACSGDASACPADALSNVVAEYLQPAWYQNCRDQKRKYLMGPAGCRDGADRIGSCLPEYWPSTTTTVTTTTTQNTTTTSNVTTTTTEPLAIASRYWRVSNSLITVSPDIVEVRLYSDIACATALSGFTLHECSEVVYNKDVECPRTVDGSYGQNNLVRTQCRPCNHQEAWVSVEFVEETLVQCAEASSLGTDASPRRRMQVYPHNSGVSLSRSSDALSWVTVAASDAGNTVSLMDYAGITTPCSSGFACNYLIGDLVVGQVAPPDAAAWRRLGRNGWRIEGSAYWRGLLFYLVHEAHSAASCSGDPCFSQFADRAFDMAATLQGSGQISIDFEDVDGFGTQFQIGDTPTAWYSSGGRQEVVLSFTDGQVFVMRGRSITVWAISFTEA